MSIPEHINQIKRYTNTEVSVRTRNLLAGSPFEIWPPGMPASLDPKLVIIGVSPGNSAAVEGQDNDYISAPTTEIGTMSNYFYPDTRAYWSKVRWLATEYFKHLEPSISEEDALLATSHLNLGTGSAGKASSADVNSAVIKWVSRLLNTLYKPDVVILLGLKTIMGNPNVANSWNCQGGLHIDWKHPTTEYPLKAYTTRTYLFREWEAQGAESNLVRVILWPNHPSRVPFSDFNTWRQAISQFNQQTERYA